MNGVAPAAATQLDLRIAGDREQRRQPQHHKQESTTAGANEDDSNERQALTETEPERHQLDERA